MIKMMNVLREYERISGQWSIKIQLLYVHEKTPSVLTIQKRKLIGIRPGNLPFMYLVVQYIMEGRVKVILKAYYERLLQKIFVAQ